VWATRFFRSSFSSSPSSVLLVFLLVLVLILVDSLYQQPSASPMPCTQDLLHRRSHFAVLFGLHLLTWLFSNTENALLAIKKQCNCLPTRTFCISTM
jgi:hypothetical protein